MPGSCALPLWRAHGCIASALAVSLFRELSNVQVEVGTNKHSATNRYNNKPK